MLFNSVEFAIFLPIVFAIYWRLKNSTKAQNILILVASYLFYGWWDWRFLSLIAFSTLIDYIVGIQLQKTEKRKQRRNWLLLSLLVNLGFLGFFKYYNFFADNLVEAFTFFGQSLSLQSLNIILPVGISFYTFQTLSYSIDIYRRKLEPAKDLIAFASYVSFFPQLVAGPIERATNLLPQFYKKREFTYSNASNGMRQILWGLFKKVVIADNCANIVNPIFENYQDQHSIVLVLGAVLFAFQIYGDFSGYSDIAIGVSKLFGFNLMTNFRTPYFSRDIAEFWRRWHISLSTWFRDYLYFPLGGSRCGVTRGIRNTFIIFLVSGFWHGANWTFVVWGGLNALFFLPLFLMKKNRKNIATVAEGKLLPSLSEGLRIISTFVLTSFAWIFFRAENINHAFNYIQSFYHNLNFNLNLPPGLSIFLPLSILLVVEWLHREKEFTLEDWNLPVIPRWSFYIIIGTIILLFAPKNPQSFIYFQF
ncbi:MBOAT family protein [Carboxylicivirga sp. A043]|uniref:MBOAT family O-acyltransferase n=1 Tax=Carboxylicivirga litoralis TaxID=2816963 RepID=UPI0021CB0742|nr:MBOAT family O-acyltransferase [Carboxylicivirga sp. A043]MCU4158054.1 MBOAT family protein [Carboxylicivirga sp. A043]